jgi:hypothetical protein
LSCPTKHNADTSNGRKVPGNHWREVRLSCPGSSEKSCSTEGLKHTAVLSHLGKRPPSIPSIEVKTGKVREASVLYSSLKVRCSWSSATSYQKEIVTVMRDFF